MMNNRGITLIELTIVVSIIAILVVALGFSFQGWMAGYNAEGQIKAVYVDLMNARNRAMQRTKMQFVDITTAQYTVYEDTNTAPDGNGIPETALDTQVMLKSLDSRYPITWSDAADTRIEFNTKGVSSDNKTICLNSNADADYNCIVISPTRINLGKLTTKITDGGVCDSANCIAK